MNDTMSWALVILGLLLVGLLIYYVFVRPKPQSARSIAKRQSTEESVNEVLRNFKGNHALEVVTHRDGSEEKTTDTEIAASAEKAFSQIHNGKPKVP
jgi:hypothetical protein